MTSKNVLRRNVMVFIGILSFGFLLSACNKNDDDLVQQPVAALMAFNLVPDQQAVNVVLSGSLIPGSPLTYNSYTGRYVNIFPGNRVVESYSHGTNGVLDSLPFTFAPNKYYSLFVVGADDEYKNVVVEDNYDSLTASSNQAYIRYVNGVATSSPSTVSVKAGGTNVVSEIASPGEVSEFIAVNPGALDINITDEGSVNATRNITVEQHKAYTILFTGLPGQTDSSKAVQIRFIENGTITD